MTWSCVFQSLVVSTAVGLGLYLIPCPIDPEPYTFQIPPRLEGVLTPNTKLQKARILFEDIVIGPESFTADHEGNVYTGAADGKIWKITGEKIALLTIVGENHTKCGDFDNEPRCGRPKGIKIDKDGNLIVTDCYKGLLKVYLPSGDVEVLIQPDVGVGGKPFTFLNNLVIGNDGMVYFTESTSKWQRRLARYEIIENNHLGRVMQYNPTTRRSKVLVDNLYMANGITLSQDESHLIIVEMNTCRLSRFWLKGPKAKTLEIFSDNLPGWPDNIQRTERGTYYVGLAVTRFMGTGLFGSTRPFLDIIGPYPALKRFITKLTPLWAYDIFLPKHCYFIEIDKDGKIIASFHDPESKVMRFISEAFEHQDKVYFGHFELPYLGVIDKKYLYEKEKVSS